MDMWVGLPENHLLEETLRFKADLFILAVYTRWPPLVSCSHLVPHFCTFSEMTVTRPCGGRSTEIAEAV